MEYELYHHGVKGMKWGVRKAITNATQTTRRVGRAISAASIEEQRSRIERSIARNKVLQKRNKRDYRQQNAKYRAKIKRLKNMRDCHISDLSDADIERGRAIYKTMKNVSTSVAITAASTVVGSVYAPAGLAAKLVGAGINAAINDANEST